MLGKKEVDRKLEGKKRGGGENRRMGSGRIRGWGKGRE